MQHYFEEWTDDDENSESNTLLISHVDDSICEAELRGIFTHHQANILQVNIVRDRDTQKALGYAQVVFESASSAADALELLGGDKTEVLLSNGAHGVVSYSKSGPQVNLRKFNMYIGNVGSESEEAVRSWVIRLWGNVEDDEVPQKLSVFLPPHPITKQKLGFAFVRVPSEDFAKRLKAYYESKVGRINLQGWRMSNAFQKLEGAMELKLNDIWPILRILKHRHEAQNISMTTVCAMGIPDAVTEKDVAKFFEAVGPVTAVKITMAKHLAFVTYAFAVSALAAISHFEGLSMKSQVAVP
eukprot:Blabericola_migrator_1__9874@NODE_543_length_7731_cov_190_656185_g410_i0_p4_GENE_NODE_543_length_7731_cov_190_656185_g410_i0NODE_543_length_7731_cov_190_656185_g410_i0_p4_ORF_typecomplete_len299_score51_30RRM_1/PF00076_22/3_2e08RRM_1/PF00076_22/0_39RRM_1/PF00076_22/1_8e07RRM_5/PF13893_6/16RRM_5/PF13893_6/4_5e03RRM_5/PF13893_6/4_2e05RRM_occluded/PF16842_5/3_9RRM_occluded/PF16842_5/0_00065DUF4523/PF15023_6/52DUF4523/PF15023_6/0_018BRAP2/PF07576_12/0_72BRAP2/PF07576_12/17PHM7_cyt/PF14703_6/9_6PHM7_